jgi:hypothetical protein
MLSDKERRALEKQSFLLQEVLTLEPGLQQVFAIARDPEPRENRWVAYEALKRMSLPYVGDTARHPHLKTSDHYYAVMSHIDDLLPESSNPVEEDEEEIY